MKTNNEANVTAQSLGKKGRKKEAKHYYVTDVYVTLNSPEIYFKNFKCS